MKNPPGINWRIAACVFVLIAVNLYAYFPSLYHVTRADQSVFLVETAELEDFGSLFNYSYSYTRSRLLFIGDKIIFRPVWYAILSLEKAVFGYRFFYWQLTSLLLHFAVCLMLWRVLHQLAPGIGAFLTTLGFSVVSLFSEMVIWHHVHGYLLFLVFLLAGIMHFMRWTASGLRTTSDLVWLLIYLTLMCFLYEFGVICAVTMCAAAWLTARPENPKEKILLRWRCAALSGPVLMYFYLSGLDYYIRFGLPDAGASLAASSTYLSPANIGIALLTMAVMSLAGIFIPAFLVLIPGQRTTLSAIYWKTLAGHFSWQDPWSILNAFLLAVLSVLVVYVIVGMIRRARTLKARGEDTASDKSGVVVSQTSAFLVFGYIMMLVVGRFGDKTLGYILGSLYHFYAVGLLLIVALYAAVAPRLVRRPLPGQAFVRISAIMVLVLSVVINSVMTRRLNQELYKLMEPWGTFIARMEDFVRQERRTPGFSFNFNFREQYWLFQMRIGDPVNGQMITGNLAEYMYRRYLGQPNPRYYLNYYSNRGIQTFSTLQEAENDYAQTISQTR